MSKSTNSITIPFANTQLTIESTEVESVVNEALLDASGWPTFSSEQMVTAVTHAIAESKAEEQAALRFQLVNQQLNAHSEFKALVSELLTTQMS